MALISLDVLICEKSILNGSEVSERSGRLHFLAREQA